MFVAMSRFVVRNGLSREIQEAFRSRPHLVDEARGFIRMEVLQPQENSDEFWLLTHWKSQEDFSRWHRGHTYREAHRGIPRGLKLVPGETELRFFDVIAE